MKLLLCCLLLLVVAVLSYFSVAPRQTEAEALAALKAKTTPTPFSVTAAHYEQLRNGLTISECNQLLGQPGKEFSRAGEGIYEVVTLSWANPSGSNITATFQGGKMVAKAQLGLQ